MKISPEEFWRSTPHEIYAGLMALNPKKWNDIPEEEGGHSNMTRVLADYYEHQEAANAH